MDTQNQRSPTSSSSSSSSYPSSSVLRLFGETMSGSSDHGCDSREKDCASEFLLSSVSFLASALLKRKRSDSPPVQSSSPSPSLSLSLGGGVSKPTTLAKTGNKKKRDAESLILERQEKEKLRRLGISLDFSLLHEPWKIRKKLYSSDLGSHCRLLISRKDVIAHIMPFVDSESKEVIESKDGMGVVVMDIDTETEHDLVFKYLFSLEGYIFRKGWTTEFVKRRELKEGDEVGLRWDICSRKLNFSVLSRATNRRPAG